MTMVLVSGQWRPVGSLPEGACQVKNKKFEWKEQKSTIISIALCSAAKMSVLYTTVIGLALRDLEEQIIIAAGININKGSGWG